MFETIMARLDSQSECATAQTTRQDQERPAYHPSPPQSDVNSRFKSQDPELIPRDVSVAEPRGQSDRPTVPRRERDQENQSYQICERQSNQDSPQTKRRKYNYNSNRPPIYADAYGELTVDERGQSRCGQSPT
jgi:hypothetical protein